ncbi:MAG: UDP-N-acetylmuramoyl-L-alanine--D-glutamate ligase [Treponema sp.]|jgi:UDP-N-acetylmuramoylalanine--D-glutamate ligase|nr:UDP-N-acetylmuramoyl-L-alanine--D-glutamate ligase [Treponema sp.]
MSQSPDFHAKYQGMQVLVMGLGLHGGGLASVRYLAREGAQITVTDLRDEKTLAPSLEPLKNLPSIRYRLGQHDPEDFKKADMVIKNPGVRPDSPYLALSRRIETDLSLFLAHSPARLIGISGSKGKSSTASALHWVLNAAQTQGLIPGKAYLGGNITASPLDFLDALTAEDTVVLELSSWQLGDLRGRLQEGNYPKGTPQALLKPHVAVYTALLPDHLDRYGTMEAYMEDKRVLYQGQDAQDLTIAPDDPWGRSFLAETQARPQVYSERPLPDAEAGGWLTGPAGPGLARLKGASPLPVEVLPSQLRIPGYHQKKNLLAAALALLDLGLPAGFIRDALGSFPGIEHRLEWFHEAGGIRFYNDTAATIPDAAAAAVRAFSAPVVLVTGGTDKKLDFSPLVQAASQAKAVILLGGSGSDRLKPLLDGACCSYQGPFDSVDQAVSASLDVACRGDVVVLSPGCASFGMFLNEFHRGRQWKEAVRRLTGPGTHG